ncbi:MAG: hypothetical protein H2038_06305 [Brevundimonas sp.]|uniref:cysteine peptidase family C39 domain-containing protein n=1 Tax=Brevundimonas TaxID=41275 RepID=UPI000B80FB1C|nr:MULTISPECIES: cysteine peptidase family C39 domain-containing protein [Brevundimonas]MBA4804243.1 hypothetical protein [Brevundimonas sp.]
MTDQSSADIGTVVGQADSGLACLAMLLAFHQMPAAPEQLRHSLGHGEPADEADLVGLARRLGARAKSASVDVERLLDLPLPAI